MANNNSTTTIMTSGSRDPQADRPQSLRVANGSPNTNGGSRGGGRHFPHIDDITRSHLTINPRTPITTLVGSAEQQFKQAQSLKTFKRVDMALEQYIVGCEYLDVLSAHPSYELLKIENKNLWERVKRLVKQIKAEHPEFEKIKSDIQADNAITGVQPRLHDTTAGQSSPSSMASDAPAKEPKENGVRQRVETISNGTPESRGASQATKTKPVVHPKPQALHGKAIGSTPGTGLAAGTLSPELAAKTTALLKARHAALRLPTPVQDPRIKTRPIATTRLSEDRSPQAVRTSLAMDNTVPGLPKMPDAIYNPARGTVSSEASNLPSSTTGRFSRTKSIASPSAASAPFRSPASNGTGSTRAYSIDSTSVAAEGSKRPKLTAPDTDVEVPDGDLISVLDLRKYLEAGEKKVKVLLIDIRHRDQFDEYHIESPATICIEPEVLMRPHLSASQLSDSMVLSPAAEQIHFEKRTGFDLIVLYDQKSQRLSWKKDSYAERAALALYDALVYLDGTNGVDSKRVKLLHGGLDAWITALEGKGTLSKEVACAVVRPCNVGPARRKSSIVMPLQDQGEVDKYEELLSKDIVRSTEEFLQKYPELPGRSQESMTSPAPSDGARGDTTHSVASHQDRSTYRQPFGGFSSEPKRPAPAAARPSYSGLAHRDDDEEHPRTSKTRSPGRRRGKGRKLLVGLVNPNLNWCYANSTLQAMYATPGFAEELFNGNWQEDFRVPMKPHEKIPNPQLMGKILTQLFHWMTRGSLSVIEAKTFMHCLRNIHAKESDGTMRPSNEILGGSSQQDAREFFTVVTDHINDETNRHRDRKDEAITVKDNDPRSLLHNALKYWKKYSTMHDSLISKYFQGLTVTAGCCPNCRNRTINFVEFKMHDLYMPNGSEASNIESLINISQSDTPHGWKCEACGTRPSHYQRRTSIARFPDRLAFCFQRSLSTDTNKDLRRITFPFQNLDLSNYFIQPEHRAVDTSDPDLPDAETLAQDHHFQSPFVYDCYAVVCHIGKTIKSGHYVAYTRNDSSHDPTDWLKYDDAEVTKGKVTGFGGRGDWANEMYGKKDQTAYLVFYERQGT